MAARLALRLTDIIGRFVHTSDQNLDHVETQVAQQAQALLRQATETAAQQKTDATPPRGPACGQPLRRGSPDHARTFGTRFASLPMRRTQGRAPERWHWVYTGTVFRLDHQGQTAGGRPVITERGFVATREVNYLHAHQDRMDYRTGRRRGEPIGSGPVEATCLQSQCRFTRAGQFWSRPKMKPCCVGRSAGAMATGTCFSRPPHCAEVHEKEMCTFAAPP